MCHFKNCFSLLFLFVILAGMTASCRRSHDDNSGGPNIVSPASGAWKVTYFFDKKDETGHFSAFVFEFQNDGTLLAVRAGDTYRGIWRSFTDSGVQKFVMNFPGVHPSALEELEEDWRIIQLDLSLMYFDHVSGGDGGTDIVKFEKI